MYHLETKCKTLTITEEPFMQDKNNIRIQNIPVCTVVKQLNDSFKVEHSLIFIQSKGRHAMNHKDTGLFMTSLSNTSCNRVDISIFNPMQLTSLNYNYFKIPESVCWKSLRERICWGTDTVTDNHATVVQPFTVTLWGDYNTTRGSSGQVKQQIRWYTMGAVRLFIPPHTTHLWWEYS